MNDQNNFLMAIILSLAVLLGWQFFVTEPRLAEERARQQKLENTSPTTIMARARRRLAANMAPQGSHGQIAAPASGGIILSRKDLPKRRVWPLRRRN